VAPCVICKVKTLYHVTPWKNIGPIRKLGLLPKTMKRGIFARDPKEPRIYFFTDRETAEDAMANWLLDEHPESRYFGVVEVVLPDRAPIVQDAELAGAVYLREPVPKGFITRIEKIDVGTE